MEDMKKAIFQLGDQVYGFEISSVNTIENYIKEKSKDDMPENVKGVISLRGQTIPVYSLRRKFKMEEKEPDKDTKYIIVESNDIVIAYEVDGVNRIVDFGANQVFDAPAIIKNKDTTYIKNLVNYEGNLVIIMEPDGILSDKEQKEIKAAI